MLQTNKVPTNQQNFDNPRDEHWTPNKTDSTCTVHDECAVAHLSYAQSEEPTVVSREFWISHL